MPPDPLGGAARSDYFDGAVVVADPGGRVSTGTFPRGTAVPGTTSLRSGSGALTSVTVV